MERISTLGLAMSGAGGALLVADSANAAIHKITVPGAAVTTLATLAAAGAPAAGARPAALATDAAGTTYIADAGAYVIRKIADAGAATPVTIAGAENQPGLAAAPAGAADAARFNTPAALALDETNNLLYIADTANHAIRALNLATGAVATICPTAVAAQKGADIPARETPAAQFQNPPSAFRILNSPAGLALGAGTLYIADTSHDAIRAAAGTGTTATITLSFNASAAAATVSPATKTAAKGAPYGAGGVWPAPARAGWRFAGWFANAAGAGAQITAAAPVAADAASHTLHARWAVFPAASAPAVGADGGTTYPARGIRQVITGGTTTTYQFYNTSADPARAAAAARSGTFVYENIRFFIRQNGALVLANTGGIWAEGWSSALGAHPGTVVGTGIHSEIVIPGAETSRQAATPRYGASIHLFSSTLARTGGGTGGSETIYIVGNDAGGGAHFHGEDVAIISRGSRSEAVNIGAGANTFTLKRGSILADGTTVADAAGAAVGVPAFIVSGAAGLRALALLSALARRAHGFRPRNQSPDEAKPLTNYFNRVSTDTKNTIVMKILRIQ
jgi:hypothetical protein